jgi:hypothetical protein
MDTAFDSLVEDMSEFALENGGRLETIYNKLPEGFITSDSNENTLSLSDITDDGEKIRNTKLSHFYELLYDANYTVPDNTGIASSKHILNQNILWDTNSTDADLTAIEHLLKQNILWDANYTAPDNAGIDAVEHSLNQNILWDANYTDADLGTIEHILNQNILWDTNSTDADLTAIEHLLKQNILWDANYTAPDNAGIDAVESRLTAARAGYLDKLNIAGYVVSDSNATGTRLAYLDAAISSRPTAQQFWEYTTRILTALDEDDTNIDLNGTALSVTNAGFVTALMADTGITAGGTYTLEQYLKCMGAYLLGTWKDKTGDPDIQEILDWEDDTTVILEVEASTSSPYKTTTKK